MMELPCDKMEISNRSVIIVGCNRPFCPGWIADFRSRSSCESAQRDGGDTGSENCRRPIIVMALPPSPARYRCYPLCPLNVELQPSGKRNNRSFADVLATGSN